MIVFSFFIAANIMLLFGQANAEVKSMYYMNNDYIFKSEYNVRNRYSVTHIPEAISTTELGTVLFGEDPGTIIEELGYADQITKLTR